MAEYEKIDGKKRLLAHVEENSPTFLVASDLDGTMMRNNSRLSEYTKDVLQRAIRRGIEFLPITGRSYRSAYDIIKDVDGIRYFLFFLGMKCSHIILMNPPLSYRKYHSY